MVKGDGFEPTYLTEQFYRLLRLTTSLPLQRKVAFENFKIHQIKIYLKNLLFDFNILNKKNYIFFIKNIFFL